MSLRTHAVIVIAETRLKETLIQPGYYIAAAAGLVIAFGLQQAFSLSIGSGGFEPSLNRLYEFINRVITSMFGETYAEQLFAGGPYLFVLFVSFLPVYFYVVVSSLFRSGMEKQVGAFELVTSGPADGLACYVAALLRDCVIAFTYLIVLLCSFLVGSLLNNLVITSHALLAILQTGLAAVLLFAYALVLGAVTSGPIAAVTSHIALTGVFALVFAARYGLVGGGVRSVASAIGAVVQWLSPLHYWKIGADAARMERWSGVTLSLLAMGALSLALVFVAHIVLRKRGVRA